MDEPSTHGFTAIVFGPLSLPGSIVGLIFVWFSLGPSLLPRAPMMQGMATALSFAFGYAIGVFVAGIVRWLMSSVGDGRSLPTPPRWLWIAVGVWVALLSTALVVLWPGWQSEQRALVGLESVGIQSGILSLAWSLVMGVAVLGIARLLRYLLVAIDNLISRWVSRSGAHAITAAIVFGILLGVYAFIASSGLAQVANARFAPTDETTLEGVEQPQASTSSGSPDSLVEWEDLGLQGRTFTGSATTEEDLASFSGEASTAIVPIRVYAGLQSADDADDRAQLVVDELNRTNAKDRAVVIIAATTGTGWVDPIASAAIEYMYNGDTAIAAMQYSYLPSWISFILDTATSTEAGIAINEAVIGWWNSLPADDRPALYAFGESLGSLGSEAAYVREDLDASLAFAQDSVDGVLWVGPTASNAVHSQLVSERDTSPVWRPTYDSGAVVRLANKPGEATEGSESWTAPRVLYFHHPSDPVGYWTWDTLWKPQEWSDEPIGYDVPQSVRWVPFTTFVQVIADLIAGFSAEVGHGHNYNNHFAEGWSVVAPPPDWSVEDTARLQAHLDAVAPLPGE